MRRAKSPRLPHYLDASHIEKAIEDIGRHGVPKKRQAKRYALRFNDRDYPPKYVICRANVFFDGSEFPNIFGGGPEANNFLIARGFEVWNTETGKRVGLEAEPEDEESTFPEGRVLYLKHRKLERDTKLAKLAKDKRLRETDDLCCDVCSFSFRRTYGNLGVGYIEAHHTVPVSEIGGKRKTKLIELALVCPNCHRMLHRAWPPLTIEGLRGKMEEAKAKI